MPKNFFNKILESFSRLKEDREGDFEKAKEILFSSKNIEQLVSAVKYINNFNKKYKINQSSAEFIYFEKMIKLMKRKISIQKRFDVADDMTESERMGFWLKNIIKESLDDLDWIRSSEINFDPKFDYNGKEYWVDISKLDKIEHELIFNYIKKVVPNYQKDTSTKNNFRQLGHFKGIVVHCGFEDNDYLPKENHICFLSDTWDQDPYKEHSLYVDGRELLEYINLTDGEEDLDESLEWSDKDTPYGAKDKNFENDPSWKNDENWTTNSDRSYWKQGSAGSTSDSKSSSESGGVNESEEDDWGWLNNTREHANYNGHPQGVVNLYSHNEISQFFDILDKYNQEPSGRGDARSNVHIGFDNARDESEGAGYEVGDDFGITLSFFVERGEPNKLSVGYWSYLVTEPEVREWLGHSDTYNTEYEFYNNLEQFKKVFKDVINPDIIKENSEWDWVKEIPGTEDYGNKYNFFEIYVCAGWDDEDDECFQGYSVFFKVPTHEAEEIWDGYIDYVAGPVDEGQLVIKWAIDNNIIDIIDEYEFATIEYVREIDDDEYVRASGDQEIN